jgi:plastocyanin
MHRWWVFLHVAGVFAFLMAHGVSAYVTFKLRSERDPKRVSHLLELSASSVGVMWNAIGVLLIGGVLAGFTGHFWGQAWIWVAIGVFLVVIVAMYAMGTTWAARLRTISAAMTEGTEAVSSQQFEEILRSRRPYTIAGVGFVGLAVLLWLMLFQPTFGLGGDPCEDVARRAVGRAVTLCASNEQAFATASLTAPANDQIQLVFDNQDDGVPHNVAIYTDDSASESLFVGDQIVGPDSVTYRVPALDPGSYYFRCDIHPVMDGSLEVS